jgi:hypothetical protein
MTAFSFGSPLATPWVSPFTCESSDTETHVQRLPFFTVTDFVPLEALEEVLQTAHYSNAA